MSGLAVFSGLGPEDIIDNLFKSFVMPWQEDAVHNGL